MPATLKPIEIYALMHDPMLCIDYMIGIPRSGFDPLQIERLERQWRSTFFMDDSGRSTGKSHNLMLEDTAKLPLIPARTGILLGMDKKIGSELFDEHIKNWINGDGHLKDYYTVRRADMEGRVRKQEYGAIAEFRCAHKFKGLPKTLSSIKTMTPDMGKEGKSLQSWRVNFIHFSEWTSWNKPDIISETITPIATRTNGMYKNTQTLRILSETHLQRPLGELNDKRYSLAFGLVKDRKPRSHIGVHERLSVAEAIFRFKNNFFEVFGFSYDDAIGYKDIGFKQIRTEDDLVRFFELYMRGDEVYSNKIIYDGSAKRPSDECFIFRKFFSDMIADGHPSYNDFNCSVEDIDPRFDGIIYDSAIVKMAKDSMLDEDYQRVYGGKWIEGYKNKPYDPASITRSMRDYYPLPVREEGYEYIIAVDSAKGTERMRSKGKAKGTGHGDDGAASVIRIGNGTTDVPHRLAYVYIAEDVRKDPMAMDIHRLVNIFQPIMVCLDPGGGGGDLADSLAKPRLIDEFGEVHDYAPIVPHDYELDDAGVVRILHFISRANEFIRAVYVRSESDKATWRGDDALVNKEHETVSSMFEKGLVEVPLTRSRFELADLGNSGKMTSEEIEALIAAKKSIDQINAIRYMIDPRTGARKKTANGLFQFASPRRKDLAYCNIYGLFMANVFLEVKKLVNQTDSIAIARG